MDYDELKNKADALKEVRTSHAKANYHYARKLGFTSYEAMLLMSKSKDDIDQLAKERNEAGGNGK